MWDNVWDLIEVVVKIYSDSHICEGTGSLLA